VSEISQTEEVKRMNLNVPVKLHNSFKSITAAEGQNMTDVLLEFIEDYIRRHAAARPKGRRA
jgi:hypothetical protein